MGTYENRGEYRIDPYAENNPPTCLEYITCTTKHHWGYEFGIGATANITRLWGLMCEVQRARMRLSKEAMYPVLHGTDIPIYKDYSPFPYYVDEIPLDANVFESGLEWVDIRFGLVFFIGGENAPDCPNCNLRFQSVIRTYCSVQVAGHLVN